MTDWRPGATPELLWERARLNADIRSFFAARGVLEVETPLLCPSTATDLHLASFVAGPRLFLQTSPEFAMKRLLAAGSGPIFQLCKAFRAGDLGERHNPEFTMLEWYRPGFSLAQLAGEVESLLLAILGDALACDASDSTTYRALFEHHFGVNPHAADTAVLRQLVTARTSFGDAGALDASGCLDLLFATVVEPTLGAHRPQFVVDFPAVQASLARVLVNADGDRVAARCEAYVHGMELANGYLELADAEEQRRRFDADNAARQAQGLPVIPVDEKFLAALAAGLPDCAGVALGVDRLLMLRTGAPSLDAVLAFSFPRT